MSFSLSSLIPSFVFGVFGMYLFKYAKQEQNALKLILALVLIVLPYLVGNPFILWPIGIVTVVLAYRV